ncbi:MAG TPA: hypothetical protein PKY82_29745, partial [Pyrinomonadaceae bacterium]|nr:hypothetical protein [Pyrinomonadaceae bacterium]
MKLIKLLIVLICSVYVVFGNDFKLEKVEFFDMARSRKIPVALYLPKNTKQTKKMPLVIFSHGYGQNSPDSYLAYSYLTENLAKNGYFVASI